MPCTSVDLAFEDGLQIVLEIRNICIHKMIFEAIVNEVVEQGL